MHAVRHGMRRIELDDDLSMLIGPAGDGALLEVGVLGLDGEDPVAVAAGSQPRALHSRVRITRGRGLLADLGLR